MTHKQIAEIIRRGQEDELNSLANELYPPRPETGTVVWFRTRPDNPWVLGVTLPYGIAPANNIALCWNFDADGVEWKPTRILADDERDRLREALYEIDRIAARWDGEHFRVGEIAAISSAALQEARDE